MQDERVSWVPVQRAPTLTRQASQTDCVFPDAGPCESKHTRRLPAWSVPVAWHILAGCPGWGWTGWVSRITLCYCPSSNQKLPLRVCVSMGHEGCCWPTPNKIWAKSSVDMNSFSLINFNETTRISTHSGQFSQISFKYISNVTFSDRLITFPPTPSSKKKLRP